MTRDSGKSPYARYEFEFTDSRGVSGNGERVEADLAERIAERVVARMPLRPLAVDVAGACALLGVSWDYWSEYIAGEIRIVRRGRRRLVPVKELERWLDDHAERALPELNVHRGPRPRTARHGGSRP